MADNMWDLASLGRRPIAACIASAFALAGPANALAATVTSCLDDGGAGTLRSVITAAAEGATIDFAGLNCTAVASKITVLVPLSVTQNSLTIDGSGAIAPVKVAASPPAAGWNYRVFKHSGNGTLTLKNFDVADGFYTNFLNNLPSYGGCIYSNGNVSLANANVSNCTLTNTSSAADKYWPAMGGAIAARGDVTLQNSNVTYSTIAASSGAKGAGIFAINVTLNDSSVSHNTGTTAAGYARGGGVYAKGNLSISHLTTLSYNTVNGYSDASGGGAYVLGNLNNDAGLQSFIVHNSASCSGAAGNLHGTARGGGALVLGNISSSVDSFIKYNSVASQGGDASGGGLYVNGKLSFSGGVIFSNTAGSASGNVRGGGARVLGGAALQYTSIFDNAANNFAFGGGLDVAGDTTIRHSTISGNSALALGGLFAFSAAPAAVTLTLENSTISDNTASNRVGGVYTNAGHVNFYNSTIAFNSAGIDVGDAPGVALKGPSTALLQNTLISNNSVGTAADDLSTSSGVTFSAASSTNLIRATTVSNLPPGSTTFAVCPLLGPLRMNGGLTMTHALLSHSPAINHGGPTAYPSPTGFDQRGSTAHNKSALNYPRISGPVVDIGAYEVQQGDTIFDTDFEGCNP